MWLTAEKRFMRHVCLRNPCLLWNLSYQKLEVPESGSTLHQLCIMVASVVVSKLWITGYWLWSWLSYICDCCKSMKNCRDSAFSLCGLEVGRPAFQLPMFEKKRFVWLCLRNPCLLWNLSLHSLPEAWGPWEGSTLHQLCIMVASVVVSKLWITGYWLWSWLSYICDCCKSMKNCRDSAFSLCGLEVGRPAFQLPMFEKKRFVWLCLRNPCLLWTLSLHSLPEAWGPWER